MRRKPWAGEDVVTPHPGYLDKQGPDTLPTLLAGVVGPVRFLTSYKTGEYVSPAASHDETFSAKRRAADDRHRVLASRQTWRTEAEQSFGSWVGAA